ncbi:phosphoinositide 3-kinase regulatory subunit 5-like [Lampris incognitus]|uniref:phosphoinositide 3-kinase regulatory subunit 5-like n=1 Tax=Lampris incognitus TaxID=2546036 RepID=UPI0024B4B049|nr:phosphoinositide 3-kinase regulatory subunit 5-like [Lampris incognitus]XP_056143959.1 phosphoinositide 3-kinase regulatory subunit 5-like [Lampris incognitus]
MEQSSSCTEDRIHHALERCLCGLGLDYPDKEVWTAGLCINRWCLEELVKRDVPNFLFLLQQILRKTKEVLERSRYELVVPLCLLFSSTLLKAPYMAPHRGLLQEAYLLFCSFLSWPEPCCSASKRLLRVINQELRAPGISFQRLVREEQGLTTDNNNSKIITVFLVNQKEDVPPEVQSVSEQLSSARHSRKDITVGLIAHAFQAALGTTYPLHTLQAALQSKPPDELEQLLAAIADTMETAAFTEDPDAAREGLQYDMEKLRETLSIPSTADGDANLGAVKIFELPFAKCQICSWEKDNFDNLSDILANELNQDPKIDGEKCNEENGSEEGGSEEKKEDHKFQDHRISTTSTSSRDSMFSSYSLSSSWSVPSTLSESSGVESDFSEDVEEADDHQLRPRKKPKKKSSSLLSVERFSLLFKPNGSPSLCRRVQSMGYSGDVNRDSPPTRAQFKRSKSLPRQVHLSLGPALSSIDAVQDPSSPQKHMCIRKRPILSCDEGVETEASTLVRVVVFGGDREAGRLARAYSDLQQKESRCPGLTRMCKLQFYFIPAKRQSLGSPAGGPAPSEGQTRCPTKVIPSVQEQGRVVFEDRTTDVAQLLGMIDPWYERSVLSLLSLSSDILCQTTCKEGSDSGDGVESLPLLADLVLYYCRNASQPALVQLYQAQLTLAGGERRREVFIYSLELGHTAGTRAVKAMGVASKRFGIDGEREAVPLTLGVAYSKVSVSRRRQWKQTEMVCTSINLYKACRKPEEIDSRTESLQLTMTEVLRRQCSKSKMGYNQHISVSEVKVDEVQVSSVDNMTTFAVCLDQDEKKIIQSVTRCEVSLCCKPGSVSDWSSYKPLPGQVQPLHPSYCSLLCLPITSFSVSNP